MNRIEQHTYPFLSGGGEMGQLIRAYDWDNSSLGNPSGWSQSLKTTVRLLLSSGHPMFIWWGPDLIQFYNDAYRRSIGSERHPSALGQKGRECWVEIWDIIGPQIHYVLDGTGNTWHENQLVPITRNGRREDVYWTYSYNPIDDPDAPNGVGGVLVVTTETTAQVVAEQRQKTAEARWRELFSQAPGFMCILTGPHHKFEFANPRYIELVGKREIIGKTVREAIPEVESQGFITLLNNVYQTGIAFNGVATPLTLVHMNGTVQQVFIDFVYQPIVDAEGKVTGIFVDGYDVTERVMANRVQLADARRKDEFLAMLAHELRNPLAPIRNAGALLTRRSTPDSTEHNIGELITRQVTQLTRLVDDLLDVSRITQGRIELQQEPVDLINAITLAIESVQPLINEKHHKLICTQSDDALFIQGDLTRIIQSVTNVLTNAAKYTEPKGHIWIDIRAVDGSAIIEIRDNGVGISEQVLPDVFELFVQADRTLDRHHGGLGIGLSIVRRLVEMHGGSITATSEGLGHGSKFQITLPLIDAPQITVPGFIDTVLKPMRLLIVDDNIDAANSLAQLLEIKGHHTAAVYDAHEALALYKTFAADIVLLDIGLPDIDGYEVARRMRADKVNSILIALTGYGQAEDVLRAHEAGFDTHVTKPVSFEELERVLEKYC